MVFTASVLLYALIVMAPVIVPSTTFAWAKVLYALLCGGCLASLVTPILNRMYHEWFLPSRWNKKRVYLEEEGTPVEAHFVRGSENGVIDCAGNRIVSRRYEYQYSVGGRNYIWVDEGPKPLGDKVTLFYLTEPCTARPLEVVGYCNQFKYILGGCLFVLFSALFAFILFASNIFHIV